MPFEVQIDHARADFPDYTFDMPLTPSEQKAAFKVRDAEGDVLCLKIISPDYSMDRLQREIEALQSINHPNVVHLKEYTFSSRPDARRHFILEEFIEGTDLADAMGAAWQSAQAVETFAPLCDGLEALRRVNVVHRDLKPQNIRLRPDGRPVIIDFGLARHLDLPDITLTIQGARIGTPCYFAPEQFDGTKRDIDHRTDLFALGILLYEALVGAHPFWQPGMDMQELRDAICDARDCLAKPEFLALDRRWQLLITRLLDANRGRRPNSAAHVATLIRKIGGA